LDLVFVSLALGILALIVALVVLIIQLISRRGNKALIQAAQQGELPALITSAVDDVTALKSAVARLEDKDAQLREILQTSVRKVGLVRFDAFDDMGGSLSYAAALLDEKGNGLVVTSISGRHECRSYAKKLVNGESEITLSKEEKEAIAQAMSS